MLMELVILKRKSYINNIDDINTIIRNLDKYFQNCENNEENNLNKNLKKK